MANIRIEEPIAALHSALTEISGKTSIWVRLYLALKAVVVAVAVVETPYDEVVGKKMHLRTTIQRERTRLVVLLKAQRLD